jgi:sugar/nucleoside kinase (ribokinase family)
MKEFDVIAIGELNVDIIFNQLSGDPEIGKEKFAQDMILTLGSSTAIFSANIATLGARTAFVGMIGKDIFGEFIKNKLLLKGVDVVKLIETDRFSTGATIVLNYNEDRANITFQGTMDHMTFNDIDKNIFEKTNHIHISSIFMQSGIKKDLIEILSYARLKGVTSSLDTQWDPIEKWDFDYQNILPLVDIFLPNEKELLMLTKSNNLTEAISKIMPYVNICVVKQGNKGSLLLTKNGINHHEEAFLNTKVVDAIGAGDSFNAGYIYKFIKGSLPIECQRFGNLIGAINTTASGGTGAFESKNKIIKTAKDFFGQNIQL